MQYSHSAEDWKAVNEDLQKSCRYVIKNQTTGDRLKIRVVAINAGGRSPPVALPEAVLVKEVAGENYFYKQFFSRRNDLLPPLCYVLSEKLKTNVR